MARTDRLLLAATLTCLGWRIQDVVQVGTFPRSGDPVAEFELTPPPSESAGAAFKTAERAYDNRELAVEPVRFMEEVRTLKARIARFKAAK